MLRNIFLIAFIFFATACIAKNYEINVNFESGFEYKSQEEFVHKLQFSKSTREIEYLISNQDWIKDYSLRYKPFKKEVFISIRNSNLQYAYSKLNLLETKLCNCRMVECKRCTARPGSSTAPFWTCILRRRWRW